MKPYDSFNQHNNYYQPENDVYQNIHPQTNAHDLWAAPDLIENQQLAERMPGPPGPSGSYQGGGQASPPRPPQGGGPPHMAPPLFIPKLTGSMLQALDPGSMKGCLYQNTYVWLRNGRSFWFYPTYVGYNSVAGYRWRKSQQRWSYYGTDASEIQAFQCF
ncbi:hypothetical protein AS888_03035 [Peribacillus simplex]|uniref:Transporter n=1 Tax=Peribacillus simplex TaxID=1478 RepID=A0A125QQY3_9BACI|nr:hypothetical protein [Peribacillus simplex]KWW11163.1 hypothetical protein AS888_03035 [Peribacillus simplex]